MGYPKFYACNPFICKLLMQEDGLIGPHNRAEMGLSVPTANTPWDLICGPAEGLALEMVSQI